MTFDVRFQVLTLPGRPYPEYLEQVRWIERLGFDLAAVPDHFVDWANPPAPWLECWTTLGALAAETSSIRLTSNVTQIVLRNPGVLAHQAVTVDQISGGRLELGLGTGLMMDPGTEMIGLTNWSNAERVARFGEYVEVVGMLLGQETTSYQGAYYSMDGAVMNPTSLQSPRVPITVAALGPKMMGHAARHADTWNTMSFDPDFDVQLVELTDRAKQMDELCAAVGRDPGDLRRSANLYDADARRSGGKLRYYDDDGLFTALVDGLTASGYTDIGLYFPTHDDQLDDFARISTDLVPTHRG